MVDEDENPLHAVAGKEFTVGLVGDNLKSAEWLWAERERETTTQTHRQSEATRGALLRSTCN